MIQTKASSRSRPEHVYPISSSAYSNSSTQTAMECEPLPPLTSGKHGHAHRSRYQATGRSNAIVNYGPYGQRPSGFSVPSHDGQKPSQSTSNNQQEHDDASPMVGVCVQQSPVVIHWRKSWFLMIEL